LIFVTVGTARDFSRLIKKIDEIARKINEKIIVQKGKTTYEPKNCEYFRFVPRKKYLEYIKRADIIITHAGVGNIISSLKNKKPTIVVPRRKKYNEHRNDHQMDITKKLESEGWVLACYDIDNLRERIKEVKTLSPKSERSQIKGILKDFIERNM